MTHLLPIDTPWAVGRVNCHLIDDDPLTLIDTGPNTGTALDQLDHALRGLGHSIGALERIVVTHQHADHCGLTGILAERAGAEVVTLDLLAPWLADMRASMSSDDGDAAALMLRHGVPEPAVVTLRAVAGNFRAFGSEPVTIAATVADGGELAFAGRTLRVWHRPGHSPTDTLLHDEASGELFGGDHLLGHVSSNPLVTRGPRTPQHERPHALADYMASMEKTAAMDGIAVVRPGHGEPITAVAELVAARLQMHERRAQKIAGMLDAGPCSAHEVAVAMWGATALKQAFLTLSEVLGHLDLLVARGEVVEDGSGDVVRFAHA